MVKGQVGMSMRFDEKGKFFTDVISKEAVAVILQTPVNRIYLRPGSIIKDEINQAEIFMAITEATIFDNSGQELYQSNFIAVHRDHILWILPVNELLQDKAELRPAELRPNAGGEA
jgi:hypothetical protein